MVTQQSTFTRTQIASESTIVSSSITSTTPTLDLIDSSVGGDDWRIAVGAPSATEDDITFLQNVADSAFVAKFGFTVTRGVFYANATIESRFADNSADAIFFNIENQNVTAAADGAKIRTTFADTSSNLSILAGYCGFEKEQNWTSAGASRDSRFTIDVVLNGAVGEAVRWTSDKNQELQGLSLSLNKAATATGAATILQGVTDGSLTISADNAATTGANIVAYGSTHASRAGDFDVRSGTNVNILIDTLGGVSVLRGNIDASRAASGADVLISAFNSSNTGSSTATFLAEVAGTSAGDASYRAQVDSGGQAWAWGADISSNSGDFVLSRSATLGANNVFSVNSSSVMAVTNSLNCTAGGVRTKTAVTNVNDTTPTSAECVTAFGAAATVGSGFVGVINDNSADTNGFLVFSNGTSYYFLKFTKTA